MHSCCKSQLLREGNWITFTQPTWQTARHNCPCPEADAHNQQPARPRLGREGGRCQGIAANTTLASLHQGAKPDADQASMQEQPMHKRRRPTKDEDIAEEQIYLPSPDHWKGTPQGCPHSTTNVSRFLLSRHLLTNQAISELQTVAFLPDR